MLTAPLKQTPEYKRLLAGMAGAKPAVVALFGMPPTARAQMLAALCEDTGRSALVVCAGEADATRFAEDAAVFGRRAEVFPARDYVLRPVEGQSHEYEYRRLAVLGNLVGGRTSVACAPVEAVLQYTTPKQEFCGNTLTVKQGMAISMDVLIERLFGAGYLRRFQVDGPGQFSVRGGIVDIYAPDMQKPHRLEFWGDEVDSIHSFDLVSQRREGAVKKIYLSPAREVLFGDTEAAARLLRTALSKAKPAYAEALADAMDGDLKALDAGTMPAAMDKYLALRYEKPATIFEYFDAPIVFLNEPSAVREAAKGVEFRFGEAFKGLLEEGVLAPGLDRFYEDTAYLLHETEKRHAVVCENFARTIPDLKLADTVNAQPHSLPPWGGEVSALADDLRPLTAQKYAVAVLAGTQRAAAALARDLAAAGFSAQAYHKEPPSLAPGSVGVFEGHLNAGADYPFAKFAVFTSRRAAEGQGKEQGPFQPVGHHARRLCGAPEPRHWGICGHPEAGPAGRGEGLHQNQLRQSGHAVCARYPTGPYQPLYSSRRRRARQALEAGRRRVEQNQKPRAQGHAGDGKRADRFVCPAPAGPGLCVPRGQRVAAGF